ncbi:MAG: DnaD domain protein [Lachnospiraceae bacterium]|nr:DnaD domain protein [Lachnospiraceae bacterium]
MSRFTIYKDNYADSTAVSNRFIDDYMKDANDAQLKIYLYLIRMMSANLPTSVSEIADKFNHTEKDVLRALRYWEKNNVLSLDYDESKTLIGIHLQDLNTSPIAPAVELKAQAPVLSIVATASELTGESQKAQSEESEPFAKPSYTLDQLKEFKSRDEISELIYVAETYLDKPLTPSEMKSILYFSDCLHFSADLIDYLIQYCVDKGSKSFRYIEKVALNWAKEGITTVKQAQKASSRYDKSVYAIMRDLGRQGAPTDKEMAFINLWTKEYGFSPEIISEACKRASLATTSHRFEYTEGILSSWLKAGVHHEADILKMDELHQKRRSSKPAAAKRGPQIPQHDYDFEALERELMSN